MPLLSPQTIQLVRELPIDAVVSHYVSLDKKHAACCPFHDEKSASFHVHPRKGIFKCFGCGAAGDGIGFVMKHERQEFIEAVETLASRHGVAVEYEQLTPEQQAEAERRWAERESIRLALSYAAAWYAGNPLPEGFAKQRGLSAELLEQEGIGYAPAGWTAFYDAATANGYAADVLEKAGLVRPRKTGGYYDYFRDRVMFPIRDWRGNVVALTGRYVGPPPKEGEDAPAKYSNSPESAWAKGEHLYGLEVAAPHIEKTGFAYCVEGQLDVLQMRQAGALNTVAVGGTALTADQILLLGRFTEKVYLTPDHDIAGIKALNKQAAQFVEAGFVVRCLVPNTPGTDPDEYLRKLKTAEKRSEWLDTHRDYISGFFVSECLGDADLGPVETAAAIQRMAALVELIPNGIQRSTYYEAVCDVWPAFKKAYRLQRRKEAPAPGKADEALKKIQGMTGEKLQESFNFGFYEEDGCLWKVDRKSGSKVRICTFTIDVLYFVRSGTLPKYVCQFRNALTHRVRTAVLSTDDVTTASGFDKAVSRLHGFVFEGNQTDLNNIRIKLFQQAKEAIEIERMGHNTTGFFAWANGLTYQNQFFKPDKYGFVTVRHRVTSPEQIRLMPPESRLVINGEELPLNDPEELFDRLGEDEIAALVEADKIGQLTYHYLPAAGSRLALGGEESDDTTSKFRHFEKDGLTFAEWGRRIIDVYGAANGQVMIAYYVSLLFRSISYKANNSYFPLLFLFGKPQSGKSTAGRSLARMFGTPPAMDGFSLESGSTEVGIKRYLATYSDSFIWLNEYKNTLDKKVLGTIKNIPDGSGKLQGERTGGNETRFNASRSTAIVSGQDLPTVDPAIFSRCIVNEYDGRHHRPEQQKELQELESNGYCTAVTCEVINHRAVVQAGYRATEPACSKELRDAGAKLLGEAPDSRSILNLSTLLTTCRVLMDAQALTFPFTYDQLRDTLLTKLQLTSEIQAVSDDVEIYLQTLAALPELTLKHGEHYQIQKEKDNRVVLLLRTQMVHPLYNAAMRSQGGTPLGIGTIRGYLQKHGCFVERRDNARFSGLKDNTSAYVLDYHQLRKQGIEFRTEQSLVDMVAVAGRIHVNGNLPELVTAFLGNISATSPGTSTFREVSRLVHDFNQDKDREVSTAEFLAQALGREHMMPDFLMEVTEENGQVRISRKGYQQAMSI